jgi:hypothetical protein
MSKLTLLYGIEPKTKLISKNGTTVRKLILDTIKLN